MYHITPGEVFCYYCRLKLHKSSHKSLSYHPDCKKSITKYNTDDKKLFTYYGDHLLPKNQVIFLLEFEIIIRELQPERLVDNMLPIDDTKDYLITPEFTLYISRNENGIDRISIKYIPLTRLPASIKYLSSLELLVLHDTNISIFPESIFHLQNLQILGLENCPLQYVPDAIGTMANLEYLSIAHTNITSLPDSIGNLSELNALFLNSNKLELLPDSLINLVNLDILSVYSNKFKAIPKPLFTFNRRSTLLLLRSNTKENHPMGIIPEEDWLNVIKMDV